MNLILDIGTSFIKYMIGNDQYRLRNGYVKLGQSSFVLNMCKRLKIDYYSYGDNIFIIGDDGFEVARELKQKFSRCMSEGRLNANEPDSLIVMGFIIKNILEKYKNKDKVAVIVSGECVDEKLDFIYHRSVLNELVKGAEFIEEGYACGLGLLKDKDFTGIGISVGGGLVNVGILYKGINTRAFSLRRACDWADMQASNMANLPVEKIIYVKENMDINNLNSVVEKIIASYIEFVFKHAFEKVDELIASELLGKEIVVGISGGITQLKGLHDWLLLIAKNTLKQVRISDIIIGDQFSNCIGGLEYLNIK